MTRGAITLARYRGAPIRLHWSVPIVALLAGGLRFAPGAWLGLLLVVLLHEMGHAFWARRFQLDVVEIVIHGLGGHCAYLGQPTPKQRAIVAWGGVLAQGLLLSIMLPVARLVPATSHFQSDLYEMLISVNLGIALFNLVPIPPLDGATAWQLLPILARERARRSDRALRREAKRARDGIETKPRAVVSPKAGQTLGDALSEGIVIDERAVRDTVRRALEDARRESAPPRRKGEDGSERD